MLTHGVIFHFKMQCCTTLALAISISSLTNIRLGGVMRSVLTIHHVLRIPADWAATNGPFSLERDQGSLESCPISPHGGLMGYSVSMEVGHKLPSRVFAPWNPTLFHSVFWLRLSVECCFLGYCSSVRLLSSCLAVTRLCLCVSYSLHTGLIFLSFQSELTRLPPPLWLLGPPAHSTH